MLAAVASYQDTVMASKKRQQHILEALRQNSASAVEAVASPVRISVQTGPRIFAALQRGAAASASNANADPPRSESSGSRAAASASDAVPVEYENSGLVAHSLAKERPSKMACSGSELPSQTAAKSAERLRKGIRTKQGRLSFKRSSSRQLPNPGPASERDKVVSMLVKTLERSGNHTPSLSHAIEKELFAVAGSSRKDYRSKARSLVFNLNSSDGALVGRVTRGEISAAELVRFEVEALAPDEVRAKRRAEREKYFREEVQLQHGPPRHRRDLFRRRIADREGQRDAEFVAPQGAPSSDEVGNQLTNSAEPTRIWRRRSSASVCDQSPAQPLGEAQSAPSDSEYLYSEETSYSEEDGSSSSTASSSEDSKEAAEEQNLVCKK